MASTIIRIYSLEEAVQKINTCGQTVNLVASPGTGYSIVLKGITDPVLVHLWHRRSGQMPALPLLLMCMSVSEEWEHELAKMTNGQFSNGLLHLIDGPNRYGRGVGLWIE